MNIQREHYNIVAIFKDGGRSRVCKNFCMDLFDDVELWTDLYDEDGYEFRIKFNPTDAIYKYDLGGNVIFGKDMPEIDWYDNYYDDDEKDIEKLNIRKQRELDYILIRRNYGKNIHYAV